MAVMTFASLSEIPDDLQDFAKEGEDGQFTVKVAAAEKITEFRENNVKVVKERDELLGTVSRYEGVTGVSLAEIEKLDDFAKEFTALRETKKRVEDGVLVENTSLEEAAQARVTEVTNTLRAQLADMAKERDTYKDRLKKEASVNDQMRIENAIRLAASDPDVSMLEGAVSLILPNAFTTFRVEENKLVPKTSDGTTIYGSDGVNPMSLKEWLLKEREKHDFLFKGSKGGGAAGSDQKVGGRLSMAEMAQMTPQQRMNYARKHGLM